jgi:hypothetical protein
VTGCVSDAGTGAVGRRAVEDSISQANPWLLGWFGGYRVELVEPRLDWLGKATDIGYKRIRIGLGLGNTFLKKIAAWSIIDGKLELSLIP